MNEVVAHAGLRLDKLRCRLSYGASCVLAPQEAAVLACFLTRPNQVVPLDTLIGAMYPDPDTEPLDARQGVRIVISRLRAKLREIGVELDIGSAYRVGYALDGVRFVVREVA